MGKEHRTLGTNLPSYASCGSHGERLSCITDEREEGPETTFASSQGIHNVSASSTILEAMFTRP